MLLKTDKQGFFKPEGVRGVAAGVFWEPSALLLLVLQEIPSGLQLRDTVVLKPGSGTFGSVASSAGGQ